MGKKFIINLPEDTQWVQWRCKSIRYGWTDVNFGAIEDLTPYTEPDLAQVRKYAYKIGYEKGYRDGVNRIGDAEDKIRKEAYEKGFDAGRMLNTGKYEKGINDAWNAVRKIYNFDLEEREELFPDSERLNIGSICEAYSASEAIEKLKAYEQKQDAIQIGDEVAFQHDDGRPDTVVVVTYIGEDGFIDGMDGRGTQYAHKNPKRWAKTGRHFPEIAAVLEKMRGEQDG